MSQQTIHPIKMAQYIVAKTGPMSHRKLQKLLYYVQGFHLGYFKSPIVDGDFEAWMHGPVNTTVWHVYKNSDSPLLNTISIDSDVAASIKIEIESVLSPEQVDLIGDVLDEYGKLNSYHLECLTHNEPPWKIARGSTPPDAASKAVISQDEMKKYFEEQMYAGDQTA